MCEYERCTQCHRLTVIHPVANSFAPCHRAVWPGPLIWQQCICLSKMCMLCQLPSKPNFIALCPTTPFVRHPGTGTRCCSANLEFTHINKYRQQHMSEHSHMQTAFLAIVLLVSPTLCQPPCPQCTIAHGSIRSVSMPTKFPICQTDN